MKQFRNVFTSPAGNRQNNKGFFNDMNLFEKELVLD